MQTDTKTFEIIISVVIAVIASSGFWTFINRVVDKKSQKYKLLVALAEDRIISLGTPIIERGYITKDEYEILIKGIGEPYIKSNGNGVGKRILTECGKLPIK